MTDLLQNPFTIYLTFFESIVTRMPGSAPLLTRRDGFDHVFFNKLLLHVQVDYVASESPTSALGSPFYLLLGLGQKQFSLRCTCTCKTSLIEASIQSLGPPRKHHASVPALPRHDRSTDQIVVVLIPSIVTYRDSSSALASYLPNARF